MAPFLVDGLFSEQTSFVIEFIIGISFGFILERSGFGNSTKIASQFYFRDMTVIKFMFTTVIFGMMLIFYASGMGWLDFELVGVPATYLNSVILGGVFLGIGFIVGGFCPGTSLVGAATGKIDAMFFIAGALFSMFLWGETAELWGEFYTKAGYYGRLTLDQVFNIDKGITILAIVLFALGLFYIVEKVEKKLNN
jgi:uncharacterized membrane protein YedE/YeeE